LSQNNFEPVASAEMEVRQAGSPFAVHHARTCCRA
jgi:hypothetical protein